TSVPEATKPEDGKKTAIFKTREVEHDAEEEPKPKSAIKHKVKTDSNAQVELKPEVAMDRRGRSKKAPEDDRSGEGSAV
ncbi:hypothetical protein FRC11_010447, partial [Ceratobasidium sp. 423]